MSGQTIPRAKAQTVTPALPDLTQLNFGGDDTSIDNQENEGKHR